ncbi:MAG: phosphate acyltransferase [Paludibacter sp.]|nr:phosphate acyltransferase [Paludibacter sp.]
MLAIRSFSELTEHLKKISNSKRLAIVNPADSQTMEAIIKATTAGLISPLIIGNSDDFDINKIRQYIDFQFIECSDLVQASALAVEMVKTGEADILMKGLVNTDLILHAVLNKEKGIVPYGNVVTFIAAMEIPHYSKLLFVTDPAVIPAPNLRQRVAMIQYAIIMAKNFGVRQPKVALIHGTEKLNLRLSYMNDYQKILELSKSGEFGDAIIAGPLDIFLALDQKLGKIKNVSTPVLGDADIVVFPGFESANIFYKSIITFAKAQMGGILFGTEKPVVMTSRSDSTDSKFNSIALACLM